MTQILVDVARLMLAATPSRPGLAGENLFVKKAKALYVERQVNPRRAVRLPHWLVQATSWAHGQSFLTRPRNSGSFPGLHRIRKKNPQVFLDLSRLPR